MQALRLQPLRHGRVYSQQTRGIAGLRNFTRVEPHTQQARGAFRTRIKHARLLTQLSAAFQQGAAAEPSLGGQDFYALLGLTPNADVKDIKKAYYSLTREFHPDLNQEEEAQELMCLLNEIYEVLTDPDKRATYDALVGFSEESLNPFLDRSFPNDQVFVDEIDCIGCGKCARQCPATFIIEGSKFGRARVINQTADTPDDVQIAIETCPVDCIHWVTVPQLSLLETALATMQRTPVWIMMRTGMKKGQGVFQVASKAWEQRMEGIRAKKQEVTLGMSFSSVEWMSEDERERGVGGQEGDGDAGGVRSREGRRIAELAAAAARAARMWRQAQEDEAKEVPLLAGQAGH